MEWLDVAKTVAGKSAPYLGGMLAGKAGSSIGSVIAHALGVEETPEAVEAALKSNPDAVVKLKQLDVDVRTEEIKAAVSSQQMINDTMRAEMASDNWFKSGWRPALGWVFTGSLGSLAGAMAWTIINDPTVVSDGEFTGMLVWLFVTMGAALGVNVKKRSDDKQVGVSGNGFLSSILTRRK